jgi:hypothetical protein
MSRAEVHERLRAGFHLIPSHMREGIILYVLDGIKGGGFLQALLCNDFIAACSHADLENSFALHGWGRFLVNHCPPDCFGNPENYLEWKGIQDD